MVKRELLEKSLYLDEELKKKVAIKILRCFVSDSKIQAETEMGWNLIFNPHVDTDEQVEDLILVLEKQVSEEDREKIDYIDLRFDKIFYKLKE